MAFFRNGAVNRVYVHAGIVALAQAGGGVFVLVYLLRAGIPAHFVLLTIAAIAALRWALRPIVLPFAKRFGVKPILIAGTLAVAAQYPVLVLVDGFGPTLLALIVTAALGEMMYSLANNTFFATMGDDEHRGHQVSAREAIVALANIAAPLMGAWALVTFGPGLMFAGVGLVQALAILPLLGAPNPPVDGAPDNSPEAKLAYAYNATDGWFDSWYIYVWQIALFMALGESFTAYGGAMAFAAVLGAATGIVLGRYVDAGHGARAVVIAFAASALVVVVRAASIGEPLLAVLAGAAGSIAMAMMSPTIGGAVLPIAKRAPCAFRFHMATEGAWDLGCCAACVVGAALVWSGVDIVWTTLLALPAAWLAVVIIQRIYRGARD